MRIFSGIQPTGRKHLGNYIGAIVQYVSGQDRGDAIYCVVDLHATTVAFDPAELRELTYDTAAILLAAGLDPDRCILSARATCTSTPSSPACYRGHRVRRPAADDQFKEKSEKQRQLVTAGLFFYPVLMAADVLAYRADEVPVGEDQRQHVELMRDIAIRFNARFGEQLVVPEPGSRRSARGSWTSRADQQDVNDSRQRGGHGVCARRAGKLIERKFKRAVTDSGSGSAAPPTSRESAT